MDLYGGTRRDGQCADVARFGNVPAGGTTSYVMFSVRPFYLDALVLKRSRPGNPDENTKNPVLSHRLEQFGHSYRRMPGGGGIPGRCPGPPGGIGRPPGGIPGPPGPPIPLVARLIRSCNSSAL